MMNINLSQHWQQLYNDYIESGNISPVLNNMVVKGMISRAIQKWNIPPEMQDDLGQEIHLAIDTAFRTYEPSKCDKVLPYVIRWVNIGIYKFLNEELYNGTFGWKYDRLYDKFTSIIPDKEGSFTDPLEEQEADNYTKARDTEFENWLRRIIPDPLEWEIYCHQWGIFGHEKLKNDEICSRLNIDLKRMKQIKVNICSRLTQHVNVMRRSKKVFNKLGGLGYYIRKEYEQWR